MLPEIYDEYKQIINEAHFAINKLIEMAEQKKELGIFSKFQEYVIQLGTVLEEKYGFEGSCEITCLEAFCEQIYKCYEKMGNDDCFGTLRSQCDVIFEKLNDCVTKADRHLSVVLIAKDEDESIEEWIEYHLIKGVSHFYIYDNDSKNGFYNILEKYINAGIVTYRWFPGELKQLEAYNHAIKHYKNETKYMAFIDADEFLVTMDNGKSLPQVIDEIISNYENGQYKITGHAGGIGVNWRNYGTSGLSDSSNELVIKSHIMRAEDLASVNVHIKTICNPRVVKGFGNTPHSPEYEKGYYNISENGSYIPSAFFFDGKCEKIRINHYYMKSEKEYYEKVRRGWPIWKHDERSDEWIWEQYISRLDEYNKVEDKILVDYSDQIQDAIANRNKII